MNYYRDLLIIFENVPEKLQNACFQVHVCNEVLIARKTGLINKSFQSMYLIPCHIHLGIKEKKEHALYYDITHNDWLKNTFLSNIIDTSIVKKLSFFFF